MWWLQVKPYPGAWHLCIIFLTSPWAGVTIFISTYRWGSNGAGSLIIFPKVNQWPLGRNRAGTQEWVRVLVRYKKPGYFPPHNSECPLSAKHGGPKCQHSSETPAFQCVWMRWPGHSYTQIFPWTKAVVTVISFLLILLLLLFFFFHENISCSSL